MTTPTPQEWNELDIAYAEAQAISKEYFDESMKYLKQFKNAYIKATDIILAESEDTPLKDTDNE